ncbi:MAG: tripartite tricarboxylate transporter substrate binding protein [Burkholderiaceae bacterium]
MPILARLARLLPCLLVLAVLAWAAPARAAGTGYPARPVQIVVPAEPGGGIDQVARWLARGLGERFAQPFVVVNRPGASGMIGAASVARADADGHTLLLTGVGHLVSPTLHRSPGYDPRADFAPVARIATSPNVLVAHASVGAGGLPALLGDARSRDGRLAYASAGFGHSSHLAAELFMERTGGRWLHVPYPGTNPALRALVAGEVQLMFVPSGSVRTVLAGGGVRALAVAHGRRLPTLPQVPTLAELGIRGADFSQWYGLFAPDGVPDGIAAVLQAAVIGLVNDDAQADPMRALGVEPAPMSRTDFAAFLDAQSKQLRALLARLHVDRPVQ